MEAGGRGAGESSMCLTETRSPSLSSSAVLLWGSVGESVRGGRLGPVAKTMVQLVLFP